MGTSVFAFVIVLGVLIFFHELGHFLVARLFGVGVEKFSLGFGPRLFGKTVGGTDYRISAIPLGGYVKMVGEEPDAEIDPEDIPRSFTHKPVFQRIWIVAAGPLFNLLLAILIFFAFYFISGIEDVTPVVRAIDKESPAYTAGLRKGDVILSAGTAEVEAWYDITRAIERSDGEPLAVHYRRGGEVFSAAVTPERMTGRDIFGDAVEYYGIGISGYPPLAAVVGGVSEDSPAQKAGLKQGDRIIAINGREIDGWNDMRDVISASAGKTIDTRVQRNQNQFDVRITPTLKEVKNLVGKTEKRYLIGISTGGITIPDEDRYAKRLSLPAALLESLERSWFVASLSVVGTVKIIDGSISRDNLGGPIMIAQMAGQQAKEGFGKLIQFIAFISINLAILNILPIPVLDGGHLMFFFTEAIIRRPVAIRVREIAQQAGMFILLMLMIFVFYNDIMRILFS